MGLYELTIDPSSVAEGERITSTEALERREFPTIVVHWESKLWGQPWSTTILLDYLIALPPLEAPQTFHSVRVGAFVGNAPTKYFYFGTEMNSTVPRLGPEMENLVTPQHLFQEFLIDERTSPIPYLKLIQATPRIFGNGAQDYYAPPIKVERFDATPKPEHLADLFSEIVAGLPITPGSMLTDPQGGVWEGSRFAGIRSIAILRQGKVVGVCRKLGRLDKETAPPHVVRRDPKLDVRQSEWVAIDVGARSFTIAARGERGQPEMLRLGATEPLKRPSEYENPSEIGFHNLKNSLKAWRDRVIQPHTRFDEVRVGFGAAELRAAPHSDPIKRMMAAITEVPLVRDWTDEKRVYKLRGYADPDTVETLKRPAPPVIDEEGIGAHDPFDPIELYAYQIGLHVNHRLRGIDTKYVVSMPTGWSAERRKSVLVAIRRGLFRSLPAGMLEYHELDKLIVADAGPSSICYLAHAHRAFSALPTAGSINFAVFEAGASETGIVFGVLREPTNEEKREGFQMVIEHLDTESLPWFGAERLLHRLAYKVWADHVSDAMELRIPFEVPAGEAPLPGTEALLEPGCEARANVALIKEAVRPLFENDPTYRLPTVLKLANLEGQTVELKVSLQRTALRQIIDMWFAAAIEDFSRRLASALQRLARGSDPYEGLRVFLGGRMSMHTGLQDMMQKSLPPQVRVHKFREPDRTNLQAPTVKTATALGALALRLDKIGVTRRAETRDAFRYRVGRARHGQLSDVLDPSVDYDEWREMGPCTKPIVEVLFMRADDDGEVAADDPRVARSECDLGADAVGRRVYLRAVGTHRVEVTLGVPDDGPDPDAARWALDLSTGMAFPV
mgnify:CR=1 FL=1